MSTSKRLLFRFLDWLTGGSGGAPADTRLARAGHATREEDADERPHRTDKERELELRMLMAHWM
jgi:hypothetical protein